MVRTYRKKCGGRPYRNYDPETLQTALAELKKKTISLRKASEKFGIPLNTLVLNIKKSRTSTTKRTSGGQTALSEQEEQVICSHVIALSTYGFPVTSYDLSLLVKGYLDHCGRTISRFNNNLPGVEWGKSFLSRYKNILSTRRSQCISRYRAALDENKISDFFDNLAIELQGVPPKNVWNYDESNLQDDPGAKKVIVKRGAKHPDLIQNATKASTSFMLCGNAVGDLAPIYITYKAENIYPTWMEGGPPGARYNRSKSGWFDQRIFEDWFEFLMLPILRKQDGTKILLGDNLSSHLSAHVLSLCEANNVRFIALPPHSTHLLQPLDVGFFRSLKGNWRTLLDQWKRTPDGLKLRTVPKVIFPTLVKKLLENLEPTRIASLQGGFKAAGIHPLNKNEVLKRLATPTFETADHGTHVRNVSTAFIDALNARRQEITGSTRPSARGKKVDVAPGRGITYDDLITATTSRTPAPNRKIQGNSKKPKTKSLRGKESDDETSSDNIDPDDIPYAESDDSLTWCTEDPDENEEENLSGGTHSPNFASMPAATPDAIGPTTTTNTITAVEDDGPIQQKEKITNPPSNNGCTATTEPALPKKGDFVVVEYKGKHYPGKMLSDVDESGEVLVAAMKKSGKYWMWPDQPDEIWYKIKQVVTILKAPKEIFPKKFLVDLKK